MRVNIKKKRQFGVSGRNPQFIIFTDKDGTIDLGDQKFNEILKTINKLGGMVVPTTGRTIGDIIENLKKRGIEVPDIIIGDNGANIYSNSESKFLSKTLLGHKKKDIIMQEFLKVGGDIDLVRYTDGKSIFAPNTRDAKNYYKNSKIVNLDNNIQNSIKDNDEITKITLAGTKEQMEVLSKIYRENDLRYLCCWK